MDTGTVLDLCHDTVKLDPLRRRPLVRSVPRLPLALVGRRLEGRAQRFSPLSFGERGSKVPQPHDLRTCTLARTPDTMRWRGKGETDVPH